METVVSCRTIQVRAIDVDQSTDSFALTSPGLTALTRLTGEGDEARQDDFPIPAGSLNRKLSAAEFDDREMYRQFWPKGLMLHST